jgi:Protein of unknown function (DUF4236)
MGFRFQKRIGLGPFGRINLSKSGVSLAEGVRGAHSTIGRSPRITLGIPGSGLSWTQTLGSHRRGQPTTPQPASWPRRHGWLTFIALWFALGAVLKLFGY